MKVKTGGAGKAAPHAEYIAREGEYSKRLEKGEKLEHTEYGNMPKWAEHNQWMGATEKDASKWKYKLYGEDQQHVLFGDWQVCFQTYIDLCNISYGSKADRNEMLNDFRLKRALEVMGYEANSNKHDYWWWADALYMVMPVMTSGKASKFSFYHL
jgi:hypothetical protein